MPDEPQNQVDNEANSPDALNETIESKRLKLEPLHEVTIPQEPVHPESINLATARKLESAESTQLGGSMTHDANPVWLVLQWLVYAFWGWAVLALSWLTFLSVEHMVNGGGAIDWYGGGVAYALASTIVLFVIALVCDIFYARYEKANSAKNGASMVIMVIHAVIFALVGIGALVTAVFGAVQLLIGDTGEGIDDATTTIISATIVFFLYVFTLLRTLRPKFFPGIAMLYWGLMTAIVITMVVLAAIGPATQARLAQEDRLIEDGLPDISAAIAGHVASTNELPTSLNSLTGLDGDAKKIVDENLVKYTPREQVDASSGNKVTIPEIAPVPDGENPVFRYSLCVTYKSDKSDNYIDYAEKPETLEGEYDTYPDTYNHKSGDVCYLLQTDYIF